MKMPFPFEVPFAEVEANLDGFVDEVSGALQSEFLNLPKGDGFVDYSTFSRVRAALARTAMREIGSPRADALRKFLKLERTKAELTQMQPAERLGWDQKTISNIERGQHRVTLIEIIELGEVSGFDPAAVVRRIAKVRDRNALRSPKFRPDKAECDRTRQDAKGEKCR